MKEPQRRRRPGDAKPLPSPQPWRKLPGDACWKQQRFGSDALGDQVDIIFLQAKLEGVGRRKHSTNFITMRVKRLS